MGRKGERKQMQDYRIIHTNSSFDSKKVRSLQFVLFPNNHSVTLRYAALHCVVVCKKKMEACKLSTENLSTISFPVFLCCAQKEETKTCR